jgi:ferredoxin
MAYVIAEPCVGVEDAACVDACPVDCIHPKKDTAYKDSRPTFDEVDKLYIDPAECIDCGACVPACPVAAIFSMEELPEEWRRYAEMDASYVVDGMFQREKFQEYQKVHQ